jgi:hypothetical protein
MSMWDRIAAAGGVKAGRRVLATSCGKCGARVLEGDADGLFPMRVDPEPLDALGEALAVLARRQTVQLYRSGGRWVMDARFADDIGYRPAGALKGGDVLVCHDCFAAPLPQGLSCWPEYAAPGEADPFEAWADDPAPF